MKHKILALGVMISCLLGLTACGSTVNYNTVEGSRYHTKLFTSQQITDYVNVVEDDIFENLYMNGVTPDNFEENVYFDMAMIVNPQTGELTFNDDYYNVNKSGYDSWYKALNDIGYNSPETLPNDIKVIDVQYYINKEGVLVIDGTIQGTKHSALLQIYMGNNFEPTDMGVTVNKTTGEKLQNAGLNTLLGMGMAFTILIIISLIISLFPIINGAGKKKESDKEITEKSIENTITQIADKEEDLSNDEELVAVIAAAIAAYEGSASVEGFQVRSIRRVNSNWKKNR
ncbi:MAG: OadG family protein [Butyrivibrio sp.]|nr:OadG family protein [Butyrivibrio sp.]